MPVLASTTLGQFCREVSIQLSPLPVLLDEWGLTPVAFEQLRNSAGYKHEMTVIATEMQELGADAGYVYRMKALSEAFIDDIVAIMRDTETPRATKVELIKFCADMARVRQPAPPPGNMQQQGPRGPSVVFHFGAGLPLKSMTLVPEAETVQGTQEIFDGDYQDPFAGPGFSEEPTEQVQGAGQEVAALGLTSPRGFQFDVPADGE